MKKLGTTTQDRVIVELTFSELANLAGFYHAYNNDAETFCKSNTPTGTDLNIGMMYSEAREIIEAWKDIQTDITKILKAVDKLNDKLELAGLKKLPVPEKK